MANKKIAAWIYCPVQLKIARDTPRLPGFAIYVWTISTQVVQI
jgi:hypothetical protein